ncbi:MAG: hypothetical protein ACTHKF_11545 [Candidatus Nitrosocosmicus sp.]
MRTHDISISMVIFIISTIGAFIQIEGASWDVTFHLMKRPDTFFTPSHTMIYSGVGLLIISAATSAFLLINNKEIFSKSFSTALKLLVIGSILSAVAGPSDYIWHSIFGIDGLLSPTHLSLLVGMLINSIAIVLGLVRLIEYLPTSGRQRILVKALMIPAFAIMWLTMIWCAYIFALPLSKGVHFNFNLNPVSEVIIATIALPFINSIVFITSSRVIGRFGGATAATALLLTMISFANIIPAVSLTPFLPWYLMLIIPAIASDLILNNHNFLIKRSKKLDAKYSIIISGAIIGAFFYILGYPMLPITFAEPLSYTFNSIDDILVNFIDTLSIAIVPTTVFGIIMGIIGGIIATKKIMKISEANKDVQSSRIPKQTGKKLQ